MPVEKISIERFLELAADHTMLDVRSPAEYKHAHVPGAHSLPLFTDEERKIVGTTYKQVSREQAIKKGLEFFGPKMQSIISDAENIIPRSSNLVLVYCWRGGMRSAAIAWLLDLYGFKVYSLSGGYKKFRNYALDMFTYPFRLKILGGYTGSGKTELLKQLNEKGQAVVDLEAIASHKGSAFGKIGMPEQPGQEMFENLLALALENLRDNEIWIEDESQRIGNVNIPAALWSAMRSSPIFFLEIPFEERLNHLIEEYKNADQQQIADAITRITEKLGGLNAKKAVEFLEQGDIKECFRILLQYYDKFYLKALHNRKGLDTLLHTINCKSVTAENTQLLVSQVKYETESP